jgi:hypothetical protein
MSLRAVRNETAGAYKCQAKGYMAEHHLVLQGLLVLLVPSNSKNRSIFLGSQPTQVPRRKVSVTMLPLIYSKRAWYSVCSCKI